MKAIAACLILAPASAGALSLDWPVDCVLGETCHIQQYMDRDPGPAHSDFTCGPLSYDGHKGTDIALPTLARMRAGVTVRAAAAGVVKGVRDGMEDISTRDPAAPNIDGRECGNGLVIDHGDGWETQYCHMRKGSLRKAKGDAVATGEALGLIGLSGNTEFPHLHLSLRKNGQEIDPFDPDGAAGCGPGPEAALWADPIAYASGGLLQIGLSDSVPAWEAIKQGLDMPPPSQRAPALVVWVHYFGSRAGDRLTLSITAPDGTTVVADGITLEKTQAQGFRAIGRKARQAAWSQGRYHLEAVLTRDGAEVDRVTDEVGLR